MITAQIASLPARVDGLERAVNSLLPQVNMIFVALNGYDYVPGFLQNNNKIVYAMMDNRLGDAAKFYDIDKREGFILTCDDDLAYPQGYAGYMTNKAKRLNAAVSLMGKRYDQRPITSFRNGYTSLYRCLVTVPNDAEVHVVGTGVLCFHTDMIKLSLDNFPRKNMADIWFAKAAHEQGVKLMVVAHHAKYVSHTKYPWRIWSHDGHNKYQTQVLNSFLK